MSRASATTSAVFRRIAGSALYVSEPEPWMFGNLENEAGNKNWSNKNWLKSRFHFSFAEYHNRNNQNFGVLRVMNDDLVQPKRGFGTHPHRDMEICTYVVDGFLTHKDSMGTSETIGRGAVQYMSAGTGVRHSEHNLDETKPLRFIQMWIVPRRQGLTPRYGSASVPLESRKNTFFHLVSDVENPTVATPVKVHQDVNMYVAELEPGKRAEVAIREGRQAYILCIEGEKVTVASSEGEAFDALTKYDAATSVGPVNLAFDGPGHVLVVEMARSGNGKDEL
jgi:redox-sensitive bicupin YhaK (pirin superfamily)